MEYSNPKLPEGINASEEHPLKEFAVLTAGVLALVITVVMILGFMADKFAHYIPFSVEQQIKLPEISNEIKGQEINRYLNQLTQRITQAMKLPKNMDITVHYIDDEVVNAFATLGGHVVMFSGLLGKLPNENALAMVLAHEVAHVKYRHPIRSMGRSVAIGLVFTLIGSSTGNDMVTNILGETGYLTALKYSRNKENEADIEALAVIEKLYGHVEGSDELFRVLQESQSKTMQYEFFSTHPLSETRIQRIKQHKRTIENTADVTTPLPDNFKDWLRVNKINKEE